MTCSLDQRRSVSGRISVREGLVLGRTGIREDWYQGESTK